MIATLHEAEPRHRILMDECQFLSKDQVYQLTEVVDKLDIPVLCYGLRTDFLGELFEGSKYLRSWADKLIGLKTIYHCGRKANMVIRTDEHGNAISEGIRWRLAVMISMFQSVASTIKRRWDAKRTHLLRRIICP